MSQPPKSHLSIAKARKRDKVQNLGVQFAEIEYKLLVGFLIPDGLGRRATWIFGDRAKKMEKKFNISIIRLKNLRLQPGINSLY